MVNVVFLDIDGVLNHQLSKDKNYSESERFGLAQDLVDNLKTIINTVDFVKIVISSSWRSIKTHELVSKDKNWRNVLCQMLGCKPDVVYGDIPMSNEFTVCGEESRAKDIKAWMQANKSLGIGTFVIIDDECSALKRAFPNNVVDCDINTQKGLDSSKAKEAIWILTNNGKDRKMAKNTWFTSDTHFFHDNILRYCNRPFKNSLEMNNALIKNWNDLVGKDDIVYHLGDFSFGKDKKTNIPDLVSKLNGKIHLILGNHDKLDSTNFTMRFYYDAGFYRVYDQPVIINNFFILSHQPLQWIKDGDAYANIYGHVHNMEMYRTFTKNTCCACVERWNYSPISWETILSGLQNANEVK